MDSQDGATTPEWGPCSSLSRRRLSNRPNSFILPSHLSIPGERASTASSDFGNISISSDDTVATSCRELGPWETFVCQNFTEQVRAASVKRNATLPSHGASHSSTLEQLLKEIALTIQFNAKWFAEGPLAELLGATLDAVLKSHSSAELLATVRLIDIVTTYSYIPQHSIRRVITFLSQTYHGATRALKTKRLANLTLNTVEKLLESHLGDQCVVFLLDILQTADDVLLQTQTGYAQVAGALNLVIHILKPIDSSSPTASVLEFIGSLRSVAVHGPPNLCEDVIDAVSQIIENEQANKELNAVMGWDLVLNTVEPCVSKIPDSAQASRVVTNIIECFENFEPRQFYNIANLAVTARRPLPAHFVEQLFEVNLDTTESTNDLGTLEVMLKAAILSEPGLKLLENLFKVKLPAYIGILGHDQVNTLFRTFEGVAKEPRASDEYLCLLSDCLAITLRRSTTLGAHETVLAVFELLCKLSQRCKHAAEFLFSMHVDVEGAVYIDGMDSNTNSMDISTFKALPKFLVTVLKVVKEPDDWAIYTCFISRLGLLLSNHALFETHVDILRELRKTICDQLQSGSYPQPPPNAELTKSYAAKALIQILVVIVSYHQYFNKQEIVTMISTFLEIAGSRDYVVSIHCVHALSVCCYEVPNIMSSYMDDVIDKMSKIVTQRMLAIHVLQFLAALSRQPELFRNFKEHDYKKIFGVCGSYLQSIRGTSAFEREQAPSNDGSSSGNVESSDALPQYVYALAHHVICFWYIALKPEDRKALKTYISSCLKYRSTDREEVIEDQGLVTIDLMDAVDADEEDESEPFEFDHSDGRIEETHRLAGTMLITTHTSLRTAKSIVTIRRPSGISRRFIHSIPGHPPVCLTITMEGGLNDFTFIVSGPQNMLTYGKVQVPSRSSVLGSDEVLELGETPELTRAVQSLDRVPALDSHKAGIIYIGEGQTDEFDILQNSTGSPDFWDLVGFLGKPRRLKDAKFNSQGLDRENDLDGSSTYVWESEVTQLVFHIPVCMPNQPDSIINKKKHTGNDAVNIVFNDSDTPFDFDTFPTQVTNAYIVIAPTDRTTFLQARRADLPDMQTRFYSVRVVARPGYPNVSSAADHAKVVSGRSLPAYVRNLVLNECIFSLMWDHRDEPGEFPSSWRTRLQQLKTMRRRFTQSWGSV